MQKRHESISIQGGNDRQTGKGCGSPEEKEVKSFLIEEISGNFLIISRFCAIPEAAQDMLESRIRDNAVLLIPKSMPRIGMDFGIKPLWIQ